MWEELPCPLAAACTGHLAILAWRQAFLIWPFLLATWVLLPSKCFLMFSPNFIFNKVGGTGCISSGYLTLVWWGSHSCGFFLLEGLSWCVLLYLHGICWDAAWGREEAVKKVCVCSMAFICSTCCRNGDCLCFPLVGQCDAWAKQRLGSRSRVAFCCKPVVLNSRSPCLPRPSTLSRWWST